MSGKYLRELDSGFVDSELIADIKAGQESSQWL